MQIKKNESNKTARRAEKLQEKRLHYELINSKLKCSPMGVSVCVCVLITKTQAESPMKNKKNAPR